MKIKVNWFKIPIEQDSRKVFIQRALIQATDKNEYHRKLSQLGCISLDEDEKRTACLKPHSDFILEGERDICELPDNVVSKLMNLKFKKLRTIEPYRKEGILNIYREYMVTYTCYQGDIYAQVLVTSRLEFDESIWDFFEHDAERLKIEIIGKKVYAIPNKEKQTYTVYNVMNFDENIARFIYNYLKDNCQKNSSKYDCSDLPPFASIDTTQPILVARPIGSSATPLYFLPQISRFVATLDQIPENVRKSINKYTKLSNSKRFDLVQKFLRSKLNENSEPVELEVMELDEPDLIAKDSNGNEVIIGNDSSAIFTYKPLRRSNINEVNILLFLDRNILQRIPGKEKYIPTQLIMKVFREISNMIEHTSGIKVSLNPIYLSLLDSDHIKDVLDVVDSTQKRSLTTVVVTIGEKLRQKDYHWELKKALYAKKVLHQNMLKETAVKLLTDDPSARYIINNLVLQILSKLGVYYYGIKLNTSFDYIIGVDVGRFRTNSYGGTVTVFNNKGIIEKVFPVPVRAAGEKVQIEDIFSQLYGKLGSQLENKKLLILRDGNATKEEIEKLPQISRKYNFKYSLVNVIKHHNTRFEDNKYNFYVKTRGNIAYFVAHKRENAKPVKLEKVTDSNGDHEINEDEIYVTYALTRLDLARIYGEGNSLRLPAPIYYADRLVKMLDKGIYFNSDDELNQHFLFFI